jgi:hypothetical protein
MIRAYRDKEIGVFVHPFSCAASIQWTTFQPSGKNAQIYIGVER